MEFILIKWKIFPRRWRPEKDINKDMTCNGLCLHSWRTLLWDMTVTNAGSKKLHTVTVIYFCFEKTRKNETDMSQITHVLTFPCFGIPFFMILATFAIGRNRSFRGRKKWNWLSFILFLTDQWSAVFGDFTPSVWASKTIMLLGHHSGITCSNHASCR